MKILQLDFHHRPWCSPLGLLLMLAGALALLLVIAELLDVRQVLGKEGAALASVEASLPGGAPPGPQPARFAPEAPASIDGASARAGDNSIPLRTLMATIRPTDEEGVAVIGLSPDPDRRIILIEARARDLRAMLSYNARLAASPLLAEVALASHEPMPDDPQQPLRFSVTAVWRQGDAGNQ